MYGRGESPRGSLCTMPPSGFRRFEGAIATKKSRCTLRWTVLARSKNSLPMFSPLPTSIETIRAGKLRALAVTTALRSGALPDIPAVAEFVPGYEASGFVGIGAPRSTPAAIVEKLNKEINAALADPQMKARLADLGGSVIPGSPADFGRLIADDTEKWAKVVKLSGAKPE
jgi:tripartite-type tricarboxylate transporter receptor subunit TctC